MTRQVVALAKPWPAKRALIGYCIDAVDRVRKGAVRFAQVGANDGLLTDPIRENIENGGWEGVMVEPHPTYFSDLSKLHGKRKGIQLVNCAVAGDRGEVDLYYLSETYSSIYPAWARGCASLKRHRLEDVLAGRRLDGADSAFEKEIASVTVPTKPLGDILKDAKITRLDFLVVDVEGFEREVLKSANLNKLGLLACMVECNGKDRENESEIVDILSGIGLVTFRLRDELFAMHPSKLTTPLPDMLSLLGQTALEPQV